MIEIYLLEQFIEFERSGTLSKAAEKLSISQPALSRSMKKLEDAMEVPLFERHKNKITLNENGKLTADYARRILREEQNMITRVRSFARSSYTLTMGANAPGPLMYYPDILSTLYPDMVIATELKDEDTLLAGLASGTYQFVFLPHKISDESFFCTQAVSERLYLSVPSTHPASSLREISFREMDGESFLMYTHVGFWDAIVRNNMPNSRFLLQYEYEDFGEIVNNTSLPCFGSDLVPHDSVSNANGRVGVPFSDTEAFVTYYFVCQKSDQKKYETLITRLTDSVNHGSSYHAAF